MVTRVVAVKEGEGGKSDRDGDEGGGQRRGQRRQSCVYIFRRNFNTIRNFEKRLEFSNHLKLRRNHNLNAFARMDISFTVSNIYRLKAETLSFLHVLLLFGVILVSSLTKIH